MKCKIYSLLTTLLLTFGIGVGCSTDPDVERLVSDVCDGDYANQLKLSYLDERTFPESGRGFGQKRES